MVVALISDWLCCLCNSNMYSCTVFKFLYFYLYFWLSAFKTIFIVNCHNKNHHKLRATCVQVCCCVILHCHWTVFSYSWKEHRKLSTQHHSITSQHTKILHRFPFWAMYYYFLHTYFHVLTYQAPGKEHDQDKQ
jgi:Na+/melibiose symporter-like transporter